MWDDSSNICALSNRKRLVILVEELVLFSQGQWAWETSGEHWGRDHCSLPHPFTSPYYEPQFGSMIGTTYPKVCVKSQIYRDSRA